MSGSDFPHGGLFGAAAYDFDPPAGYLERWSKDTAERIERDAAAIRHFLERAKQSSSGVREPSPAESASGSREVRAQGSTSAQASRGEQDE